MHNFLMAMISKNGKFRFSFAACRWFFLKMRFCFVQSHLYVELRHFMENDVCHLYEAAALWLFFYFSLQGQCGLQVRPHIVYMVLFIIRGPFSALKLYSHGLACIAAAATATAACMHCATIALLGRYYSRSNKAHTGHPRAFSPKSNKKMAHSSF